MKVRKISGKTGATVELREQINKGGQGCIFRIDVPGSLAKIYSTDLDPVAQDKLRTLVASGDSVIQQHTAWPTDVLLDRRGGEIVGFVMPSLGKMNRISDLISQKSRQTYFPQACWDFLLHVGRNLAAAFDEVHSRGFVVGDVNDGNAMVARDGSVRLIDVDSFQLAHNATILHCPVAVPIFTPPELHGADLSTTRRTVNHDGFGLAVLIFQLLYNGRHPFAGRPLADDVSGDPAENITAYRYAYARDHIRRKFDIPRRSLPRTFVPERLQTLFENAFTEYGVTYGRPTASQWLAELDALADSLTECANYSGHVYSDHLDACPWCALAREGLTVFPKSRPGSSRGAATRRSQPSFDLGRWRETVQAIHVPSVPKEPQLPPNPGSPVVESPSRAAALARCLVAIAGIWAFAVSALVGSDSLAVAGILTFAVAIGWRLVEYELWKLQLRGESQIAKQALTATRCTDCGQRALKDLLQQLLADSDAYVTLQRQLTRAQRDAREAQKAQILDDFLVGCHVAKGVPGFSAEECGKLQSHLIWNATDVTADKINALPPRLAVKARQLYEWRKSCREAFVASGFSIPSGTNTIDDAVAVLSERIRGIEATMTRGLKEANAKQTEIAKAVAAAQSAVDQAALEYAARQHRRNFANLEADWTIALEMVASFSAQMKTRWRSGLLRIKLPKPTESTVVPFLAGAFFVGIPVLMVLAFKSLPSVPEPPSRNTRVDADNGSEVRVENEPANKKRQVVKRPLADPIIPNGQLEKNRSKPIPASPQQQRSGGRTIKSNNSFAEDFENVRRAVRGATAQHRVQNYRRLVHQYQEETANSTAWQQLLLELDLAYNDLIKDLETNSHTEIDVIKAEHERGQNKHRMMKFFFDVTDHFDAAEKCFSEANDAYRSALKKLYELSRQRVDDDLNLEFATVEENLGLLFLEWGTRVKDIDTVEKSLPFLEGAEKDYRAIQNLDGKEGRLTRVHATIEIQMRAEQALLRQKMNAATP